MQTNENLALSYIFPMCTQSKFSSSAIERSVSSANFLIDGHTLILVRFLVTSIWHYLHNMNKMEIIMIMPYDYFHLVVKIMSD